MIIGWREYIKNRFKTASQFHSVGIMIGLKGIQISSLKKVQGELRWVQQHFINIENWQVELKTYVEKEKLGNTKCHVVLAITKYKILHIDKPAVAEVEIIDALQWNVKEQLATDEQLVIDYFEPPASTNSTPQINVVALTESEIIHIRNGILKAGLQLENIGIEELIICNLCAYSDHAVILLKQQQDGQLSLNIIKQNQLYFSRRLKGYESIGSLSAEELAMGIADNLSLEIQRSMDYFESQMRQAPIKQVYIAIDSLHQEALAELIKNVVYVPVEKFVPYVLAEDNISVLPASFASLAAAIHTPQLAT
ncbi:MSHA biogenesis protein MshI [Paraglaciecola aquimarina]|uniref:MSHA biogenesis protein MshI n=1 Tax=Paraglaciecola algarum TaxID=3050085 RepID=A0ABS9D3B0_9ALTE|nr:MSHA biogenesis protein MshI [Paraglaciecola sp. G1-23]MCF2947376.1 MSHA biogenesis protein MshI [Paraglaciecola sp. G1-23]